MVRLEVKNIKNVENALKKYGEDAVKEFEDVVFDEATTMMKVAQLTAQSKKVFDIGTLVKSIIVTKGDTKLSYDVGTNLDYAPYMEFGTGVKVKVPIEFTEMANKARGKKGSFEEGLKSIKTWCHHKGIDESLAYIIFINILNNGIEPRPFMYPAFLEGRKTYKKGMKEAVKRLNKKFNDG
jgi:HK97 gp10 family phage protein